MRACLFALVVSSTAVAQPALPPIDTANVPPGCAALAAVPGDAAIPRPAIEARISLAGCAAMAKMSALKLVADDASVTALAEAAKPSLELYQIAIDQNDPVLTPIAKAARADLYGGMAVRLRAAVPAITMQTVGEALADRARAHAFVESKVGPWLDKARDK
jgi:hypothetical protein